MTFVLSIGHGEAVPRGIAADGVRGGVARRRALGPRPRPLGLRGTDVRRVQRRVPEAQRGPRARVALAPPGVRRPRPPLRLRDAAGLRLEQPRDPVDRRGDHHPRVRLPGRLPQPRHVAGSGLEVPGAGQPRPRLRAPRHRAALRIGPRPPRRGHGGPQLDAPRRPGGPAPSLDAEARRRLRPGRLRHEGGPRPHAHLEAGRLPRGAVAGGRPHGGGHAQRRALLPAAHPPDRQGRPGSRASRAGCCWRWACCPWPSPRRSS